MDACRYLGRGNGINQANLTPAELGRAGRPSSGKQSQYAERSVKSSNTSRCAQPARDAVPAGPSTHRQGRGAVRGPAACANLARRCHRLMRDSGAAHGANCVALSELGQENPRSRNLGQA